MGDKKKMRSNSQMQMLLVLLPSLQGISFYIILYFDQGADLFGRLILPSISGNLFKVGTNFASISYPRNDYTQVRGQISNHRLSEVSVVM